MVEIHVTWNDLSRDFKDKILQVFGDNMNWDVIPMSMFCIEDERDIVIDSVTGDTGFKFIRSGLDVKEQSDKLGASRSYAVQVLDRIDDGKVPTKIQIRNLCMELISTCRFAQTILEENYT